MPSFPHHGHSFYYEDSGGTGTPVVALPGVMSDSASWGPVVPGLAARHRLIRPDPRCAGRSPVLPTSVEAMVADTCALLDHLGLERVHVISHSMGSRVALELAVQHPERVDRVMISAVLPRFPRLNCSVFESLLHIRETAPGDAWLRALYPWLFGTAFFEDDAHVDMAIAASLAYPHAQTLDGMRHQVRALSQSVPVQGLHGIAAPVLALFGTEDRLVPVRTAPDHLAGIPDCTVQVIDGAGHAVHWDQPEAVLATIGDFLA